MKTSRYTDEEGTVAPVGPRKPFEPFAPHGPRNRHSPRMRLRRAKSISTIFLSRIKMEYCFVLALSRAT